MNKTLLKRIAIAVVSLFAIWMVLFTTEKTPVYSTVTLSQKSIAKSIDFTALWYPVSYAKVTLGASQDITKIYVKEGDRVTAGTVIAQLANDVEYNQFKTAQASYYAAINNKKAVEKAAAALPPNPSTNTTVTQLQGVINSAYYQMKTAEASLNKKKLKAPITGSIASIVYEDFNSAASLTTSLTGAASSTGNYIIIANNKDPRIAITMSEQDVVQLAKGMKVSFTSRVSTKIYTGEILNIAKIPVVQLTSTTEEPSYKVIIKLDSYIADIPYGARLEGTVSVAQKDNAQVVSYDAVTIESETEGSILVLSNGKTERKNVKLGIIGTDSIEIIDGVSSSDQVVIDSVSTKSNIVFRPWIKKLINK